MLHLISQSPIETAIFERIGAGDDVLLLEASVCIARQGHYLNAELQRLQTQDCQVFTLDVQLALYGIEVERLLPGINVIDYSGFVELTVKNPVIQTWR